MLLADGVAAGVAEQDGHLSDPEGVLGAEKYRDAESPDAVAREQSHHPALTGQEAAGDRVGPEPQLLGGLENALPGLGADLGPAVDRLRGRRDGHPGPGRDVRDRDGSWSLRWQRGILFGSRRNDHSRRSLTGPALEAYATESVSGRLTG